jgi:hypothetical protein
LEAYIHFSGQASTKNNIHPSDYIRTDDLYGQIKYILYSANLDLKIKITVEPQTIAQLTL